ncbi:MAG: arginase family protein [Hyphomicrobiaceae bacterium]
MTVLHVEEVDRIGLAAVIDRARQVVGSGADLCLVRCRQHIDRVSRREQARPRSAGSVPREALTIVRGLAGIDIIGGDVVEVAPQYDASTATAQIGAQMLFELVCLVALRAGKRE